MAGPRATWKGFLKLSLVTCPISLFSATSEADKVKFNQINSKTGNRVKQQLVDAETGDAVDREDIVKGYEHQKGQYLQIQQADLDNVKLDSNGTIEIVKFVPKEEIDDRYYDNHYFLAPSDKVGTDAFAVIREAMKEKGVVGLGRVVMSQRERIIMLMPSEKGVMASTLRYDYEIRNKATVFDDIPDVVVPPDMLQMAGMMIQNMTGSFDPSAFQDRYEAALQELIKSRLAGAPAPVAQKQEQKSVIDLMAALRASIAGAGAPAPEAAPAKESKSKAPKVEKAAKEPVKEAEVVSIAPAKAEAKADEAAADAKPDRKRKRTASPKTMPTSESDLAEDPVEQPKVSVGF